MVAHGWPVAEEVVGVKQSIALSCIEMSLVNINMSSTLRDWIKRETGGAKETKRR